ncbi:MAG: methyl-accepting chemotaxis protein [Gammaproteobacteria bacterium]|nr:methyl-accepting chemotaxis protein [Gammaproteobacteria bacterium]
MLSLLSNRSIKFRLSLLFGIPLAAMLFLAFFLANHLTNIQQSFNEFNDAGVQSQKFSLMISRDMNYVSRLTRSIMLGDDYQKNLDKLNTRIDSIFSHFKNLQNSTAAISDQAFARNYLQAINESEQDTRAFLEDGRSRMLFLGRVNRTERVLNQAWLDYKKAASPLANKARKSFAHLTKLEDEFLAATQGRASGQISNITNILFYLTAATIVLTLLFAFIIAGSITRPIVKLQTTIQHIATHSDLTQRLQMKSKDELGAAASAFDSMLEKFHSIVDQIRNSTQQLNTASTDMSKITNQTSGGVKQQHAQLEQVATAMNQMRAAVQEVSRHASDAAMAAQSADDDASNGQRVVEMSIQMMNVLAQEIDQANGVILQLKEQSMAIGSVLDVIQGVAEQTNLLALNAAIEAARAGEHGRGFTVVADEVRVLASRTQQSTQEIQAMIETLQVGATNAVSAMTISKTQAQKSVETVQTAGESLKAITHAVTRIRQMNDQIASAAEEQRCVAEEINQSVVSISDISQDTASGAEQSSTASSQVTLLAGSLRELTGQFVTV